MSWESFATLIGAIAAAMDISISLFHLIRHLNSLKGSQSDKTQSVYLIFAICAIFLPIAAIVVWVLSLSGVIRGEWIGPLVAFMITLGIVFLILQLTVYILTSEDRAYNDVLKEIKSSLANEESRSTKSDKNRGSLLIRVDKEMKGHEVTVIGKASIVNRLPVEQQGKTYVVIWKNVLCDNTYKAKLIDPDHKKSDPAPVHAWKVTELDWRLRKSGWISELLKN